MGLYDAQVPRQNTEPYFTKVWLKCIKFLPNDKILDLSKLKAFEEDYFKVAQRVQFLFDKVKNNVRIGENAGLPAFSHFPTMSSKGFFSRFVKSQDCV